ncbi:MAG: Lrp/AsnC family transcriptional regulator [Candidatus Odinarchaeota archaeon]|nr:Lrp/AsnC family transcriptional regulator [Candidatus Odinarchaeota archaeon]
MSKEIQKANLLEQFKKYVNDIMREYKASPYLEMPKKITIKKFPTSEEDPMWFGVKHSDGEIVIHKKYTKIINGILEREAFRLFLPKKVTSLRFGFDLAMLYTYNKLPKKHKRKWMELWNLYKISFDFVSNLTYKAPEMLLQLYTINKNKFIIDALTTLNFLCTENQNLDNYVVFLHEYKIHNPPRINDTDLKVLKASWTVSTNKIEDDKGPLITRISELTGLAKSTVSKSINKLLNMGVCTIRTKINFNALGLKHYFLIVEDAPNLLRLDYLLEYPFIYQIEYYPGSKLTIFVDFIAPIKGAFRGVLEDYAKILVSSFNTPVYIFSPIPGSHYEVYNFRFYKPNVGWLIQWPIIENAVYKMLTARRHVQYDDLIQLGEHREYAEKMFSLELDRLDLDIIENYISDPEITISNLRRKLRIDQNTLVAHIKKLREKNLISRTPRIEIGSLGFTERAFLMISGQIEDYKKLINAFKLTVPHMEFYLVRGTKTLPKTLRKTFEYNLIVFFSLPTGGAVQLSHILFKYLPVEYRINIRQNIRNIKNRIPISFWNTQTKKWETPPIYEFLNKLKKISKLST